MISISPLQRRVCNNGCYGKNVLIDWLKNAFACRSALYYKPVVFTISQADAITAFQPPSQATFCPFATVNTCTTALQNAYYRSSN